MSYTQSTNPLLNSINNECKKQEKYCNFLFRRSDESLSAMAAHDQPVGPLTALLDTLADTATPLFTRDGLSRSFIDIAAFRPPNQISYSTTAAERRAVTAAGSELIGLIVTLLLHHIRHLAGAEASHDGADWRYVSLWSLISSSAHLTRPHVSIATMHAHYPDVCTRVVLIFISPVTRLL